ncbi:hypothetical protein DPX16_23557 [Anabarilius grahami]|uniref:Uncharacterized protein n=1 Tax=Anabarilius grahami TaxID=495550 RepID=A0A3N0Y0P6_ANAGA|nr:hypothetical protein DPX16_23557 [Anabarilius grahami]
MGGAAFLKEEGRAENPLSQKSSSSISGSKEGTESSGRPETSPRSSSCFIANGQQRTVRGRNQASSRGPCQAWNQDSYPSSSHRKYNSVPAELQRKLITSVKHMELGK